MGSITTRRRKGGGTSYLARIRIKHKGKVIHEESRTFPQKMLAKNWIKRREIELEDAPQPEEPDTTLGDAIRRYVETSQRKIGRTKAQVLRALEDDKIAAMPCHTIKSDHIVDLAERLGQDRQAQTVGNYLSHLSSVFQIAGPAWGIRLDPEAMRSAHIVCRRLGYVAKSQRRDRRPTIDEMTRIVEFFEDRSRRAPQSSPMHLIVVFAMFSTRRQDEITRITWDDYEGDRVMVRDMKHPGQKQGNDQWVDLPPEARAIIDRMPNVDERIFPYTADAICAAFTRACRVLGIEDLHFHDLRHEGVSRLFEMGWSIPHVATVSGHRSWQSLQRYAHVRQTGDRWADWKWGG